MCSVIDVCSSIFSCIICLHCVVFCCVISLFYVVLKVQMSCLFINAAWLEYAVVVLLLQCFDAVGWVAGRATGPVKNWVVECWRCFCLELGADLHMAQLMPLPLTVSCFSKIQIGFTFLVPAHPGSLGKRAVKRVCVCVCVCCCCLNDGGCLMLCQAEDVMRRVWILVSSTAGAPARTSVKNVSLATINFDDFIVHLTG